MAALTEANPHVLFGDGVHRGYLLAEVTARDLHVRLRVADDVTLRAPKVSTAAAWAVEAGKPGAQAA